MTAEAQGADRAPARRETPPSDDPRPVGAVLQDLSSEAARLVRHERRLIMLEADRHVDRWTSRSVRVLVATAVGVVAVQCAAVTLVVALDRVLPLGAAAAIVTAALSIAAWVGFARSGRDDTKTADGDAAVREG